MIRAKGIDVNHWKPVKSWQQVYDSGVKFVGVKATEGKSFIDPKFKEHRAGTRTQPFLLTVYYHFARPGEARRQAERLMDVVGPLLPHERLCLDLEAPVTDNPRDTPDWVTAFYETLLGEACRESRPWIYTSKRIWYGFGNPEWQLASEVDLWAPRYNAQGIEPSLPKPWEKRGWVAWQYSDGEFPEVITPGVGKCDANWFKGDDAALAAYAQGNGGKP